MNLHSEMSDNLGLHTKLKDNYDSYYEGESSWRGLGAIGKVQNIVDLCDSIPHRKILDLGSGEGALLKRLSDLNFGEELYALEVSQSAVTTIVRRDIPCLRECRVFDGYCIPYAARQFDLVIMSHVLEHVEYPRKLLYEASRVADYIFVEVPLEDTMRLKADFVFDSVGHINFYSRKTIRRLVQTCDLRVLSQVVTNPSRAVYEYQSGRQGSLKYMVKEALLRATERLACQVFTYHCALVCTRAK
jgi:SAM-dependent methyltransferase